MNRDIWVIGTLNQQFIRSFYAGIKLSKKYRSNGKTPIFVISQFCAPYSIYLNIGF